MRVCLSLQLIAGLQLIYLGVFIIIRKRYSHTHIDHAVILLLLTPTPPFLLTHAWWHRHGGGPGSIQILRMATSTNACVSAGRSITNAGLIFGATHIAWVRMCGNAHLQRGCRQTKGKSSLSSEWSLWRRMPAPNRGMVFLRDGDLFVHKTALDSRFAF